MPQYVLAPAWPEPDVEGAERSVLVEPIVGIPVVVLVTVPHCNVIALPTDIDDRPAGMDEDGGPHVFVVAVPTLVVVRVNDVERLCANAIEGEEDEPCIVRIAPRRPAPSGVGPRVVARRQMRGEKVAFTLAEVVEQIGRVARVLDVVFEKPVMLELRLQLTEEQRDQIAVARNELERPGNAFVGIAEGVNGVHAKRIVVDGYTIENDLLAARFGCRVEGDRCKAVVRPGFEEGCPEPQQALACKLDIGSDKQQNVRLSLLPGRNGEYGLG